MKKLPVKFIKVEPMKGDTVKPEFLAKFPAGVVPALDDQGFYLTEAHSILPYLADKHDWLDIYPKDLKQRAVINQWLHWHHTGLRPLTWHYFVPVMRRLQGIDTPKDPKSEKKAQGVLEEAMAVLKYGALVKSPYLAGETVTLADLCLYCELDQLEYLKAIDFSKYPEVQAWMSRMKQVPEHDPVRQSLRKLAELTGAGSKL